MSPAERDAYTIPDGHPMTVRVTLTVRVSRDRVSAEYGSDHTAADVREYVRRAAESATASALSHVDADVALMAAER